MAIVSQSISDESRLLRSITSRLVDGLVFPNIEVGVRPDGPIKGHRPDAAPYRHQHRRRLFRPISIGSGLRCLLVSDVSRHLDPNAYTRVSITSNSHRSI
jgi:hypothetical protein